VHLAQRAPQEVSACDGFGGDLGGASGVVLLTFPFQCFLLCSFYWCSCCARLLGERASEATWEGRRRPAYLALLGFFFS
jgi:hypothetical protein